MARVSIWDQPVGAVSEDATGRVVFEYAEAFRASALEISPLRLPLALIGPQEFPELRRVAAFAGLPGVLADALPDAFGNAVIKRFFEEKGTPGAAMSPVQKLLYIGSRAMGALEFTPPIDGQVTDATDDAIQVARLVDEARRVIEGDTHVAVPEMMQVGASAGGARAKALILWNRDLNRVKSAFASHSAGDEPWLIKFDGVTTGTGGPVVQEDVRPGPYGRIEYAYAEMARTAGIEVAETHLLREREFAHFMTKRFDRIGATRLHMHSLAGLRHIDYNERGAYSYEEYLRTIREMGLGQQAVNEGFRRMVFNVAAVNQDDHVKNLSFLMTSDGQWRLSPAYDLTYARGNQWTRTHQMWVAGKDDNFTREDLLGVGEKMDVPHNGAVILSEVEAAIQSWGDQAAEVDVPSELVTSIRKAFRHFAKP